MASDSRKLRPGIFIMVKYPELGKVKERLAQSIGEEAATSLYQAFIQDTLGTVRSLDVPYHIAVLPPKSQKQLVKWLGTSHRYIRQKGQDLGERLHNGFVTMFGKKYQQVIALASDCPDLPVEILQAAVSSLQTNEAVIGPAPDGGYYLIGFAHDHFIPNAFRNISWSTDKVLHETLSRFESEAKRVHILPEWQDIDTKNDLQDFFRKYQFQTADTLQTMKYIRNHQVLLEMLSSNSVGKHT
ncbi:MAG: TIGR04282 family arsenosugar biosynthesis glycosyltransferase [Candidatus Thorarchaeota archaeon]